MSFLLIYIWYSELSLKLFIFVSKSCTFSTVIFFNGHILQQSFFCKGHMLMAIFYSSHIPTNNDRCTPCDCVGPGWRLLLSLLSFLYSNLTQTFKNYFKLNSSDLLYGTLRWIPHNPVYIWCTRSSSGYQNTHVVLSTQSK